MLCTHRGEDEVKTVFLRVLQPAADEKAIALREAIRRRSRNRYEVDVNAFSQVPHTPFAYWVNDDMRHVFERLPAFESADRTARQGLATADDFRFVRLATEVPASSRTNRWFPFAKGGKYSIFYADISLLVNWEGDGAELRNFYKKGATKLASRPQNIGFYFRPGVTWPLRTSAFCPQALPAGSICSVRGSGAYASPENLLSVLAVCSSSSFDFFFKMALGRFGHPEFVIGTLQGLPWPKLTPQTKANLHSLASAGWHLKWYAERASESSHAFLLPALAGPSATLSDLVEQRHAELRETEHKLSEVRSHIDHICATAYGITVSDLDLAGTAYQSGESSEPEVASGELDAELDAEGDTTTELRPAPMVTSLLSWSLGVALGRFDVRLAAGDHPKPSEPEPFDPLPICAPGLLAGDDGLPVQGPPLGYPLMFPSDGILVDDLGHARDVVAAVRVVFDIVFDDGAARWDEATELLGAHDLRGWFAHDFFEQHIKRYSMSRRKAPIYWQLATPSGSYSVWVYIHRATGDTLFRVLNDFVGPKLDHEKATLDRLVQESGTAPSATQRGEIDAQETFVSEIRALHTEVARVAPLWQPNLDDGVILNFAPLWRLVPHIRSWQTECKKAWDQLVKGDYDWSHLAMHLWPERVVAKCIDDRSLSIAHGLDDVFWREDESGKWEKLSVDDTTLEALVSERTSSTVKAALANLLSAPTPARGKGQRRASRAAAQEVAT